MEIYCSFLVDSRKRTIRLSSFETSTPGRIAGVIQLRPAERMLCSTALGSRCPTVYPRSDIQGYHSFLKKPFYITAIIGRRDLVEHLTERLENVDVEDPFHRSFPTYVCIHLPAFCHFLFTSTPPDMTALEPMLRLFVSQLSERAMADVQYIQLYSCRSTGPFDEHLGFPRPSAHPVGKYRCGTPR